MPSAIAGHTVIVPTIVPIVIVPHRASPIIKSSRNNNKIGMLLKGQGKQNYEIVITTVVSINSCCVYVIVELVNRQAFTAHKTHPRHNRRPEVFLQATRLFGFFEAQQTVFLPSGDGCGMNTFHHSRSPFRTTLTRKSVKPEIAGINSG